MWETHDEVLALPFLVWSISAHFSGHHRRKLMLLLPTLFFKETLALNVAALSLWYTIDAKEDRILPMMLGIISLVLFILYTSILPGWLWTSTFKATERIGSIAHLTSWPIVIEKTIWAANSFIPAVPFLFLHSRSSLRTAAFIALCASPNILAILVSKVPNMHQPLNYYSITPCVIIYVACAAPIINSRLIRIPLCASLIFCSLVGGRFRITNTIREMITNPSALSELHTAIPSTSTVIADDYAISLLSAHPHALRIFHANRSNPNSTHIVQRKPPIDKLSRNLEAKFQPCGETKRYIIRCRVVRTSLPLN
jgi:hypothetical protein